MSTPLANAMVGRVYLVGAGPGDPGLITVRGLELVRGCDVLVYDRLVAEELVWETRPDCRRVFVGKRPGSHSPSQEEINGILIREARSGRLVVRLKGGDPFLFGRGGEEVQALTAAGVPVGIVPGVTSATGVLGHAGIPLTDRRWSSSAAIVTAHSCGQGPAVDWESVARLHTVVVLMTSRRIGEVAERLLRLGRHPSTPLAAISRGTWPDESIWEGTLEQAAGRRPSMPSPAILVVGEVVRLRHRVPWPPSLPRAAGSLSTSSMRGR